METAIYMRPGVGRARRRKLGLTQGDVADAVGVTVATVCRWEKRRMPVAWDRTDQLAEALGGKRGLYRAEPVQAPRG
jgi:transcriptional regulator with XRE-family HTH domain